MRPHTFLLFGSFIVILFIAIAFIALNISKKSSSFLLSPASSKQEIQGEQTEKKLSIYTFEALKKTVFKKSAITIGKKIKEEKDFVSYVFYYTIFDISSNTLKKVSGLLNTPTTPGIYPVIVMFRGYVPQEKFITGEGSRRAGEVFAKAGFITLAPDFLGYGESDFPSQDPLEERFQTYTTALALLVSLSELSDALAVSYDFDIKADAKRVGLWGHSNGGHIGLSVLAITGIKYPTVLWNPVSKPFPYSILFFTDDSPDHGKAMREMIAGFEKHYDIENYSTPNYFDWITAPISLHQATDDEAVPLRWSDYLYKTLEELGKDIIYTTYAGDDHNFSKGNWSNVVRRNIAFYQEHLPK